MVNLTFGEQVKIILNRKGMTIKELAEQIELCTGKKMSRQNLTQRLGRDNFQERDMRLIAQILGCPFHLSILATNESVERAAYIEEIEPTELEIQKLVKKRFEREEKEQLKTMERAPLADETITEEEAAIEREVTLGDLVDMEDELEALEEEESIVPDDMALPGEEEEEIPEPKKEEKKEPVGDINPYTRKEYETNSVRMHPKRIGYVQVYDRTEHKWTDMTEWAFLGFQERKKRLQGKNYIPPTYLD